MTFNGNVNGEKRYMTRADLARYLSVSVRTIQRLASAGKIPSVRIADRCVRYDPRAVEEVLVNDWPPRVK